jgi:nitrile hydratase subunit beta
LASRARLRLELYGLVTEAELRSGRPASGAQKANPPLTADIVATRIATGSSTKRALKHPARFALGQKVRAKKVNPTGHTRLPRYARGCLGIIQHVHDGHVFPDSNAMLAGENPQYLYSVQCSARELWGETAAARDAVYLDLWEDYLKPVG